MRRRLFIISNRLPINIDTSTEPETIKLSSGGLVSAISSYLDKIERGNAREFTERIWVGVPGCKESIWRKLSPQIPSEEYQYIPVFNDKKSYEGYYNGMSNSVIWALFHYFPSFADFNSNFYEQYKKVNEEFCSAEAIA